MYVVPSSKRLQFPACPISASLDTSDQISSVCSSSIPGLQSRFPASPASLSTVPWFQSAQFLACPVSTMPSFLSRPSFQRHRFPTCPFFSASPDFSSPSFSVPSYNVRTFNVPTFNVPSFGVRSSMSSSYNVPTFSVPLSASPVSASPVSASPSFSTPSFQCPQF